MRPACLCVALCAALTPALAPASSPIEQWKAYAQAGIAPDFDWYRPLPAPAPRLGQTLFTRNDASGQDQGPRLSVSALSRLQSGAAIGSPSAPRSQAFDFSQDLSGRWVQSRLAGTRLGLQGTGFGEFGLSAIIARQHFATQGFGYGEWDGSVEDRRFLGVGSGVHQRSTGSAVRVDWRQALSEDGWQFDAALQSRIEMDPFKAYRGVYSEAGDFDLPGYARLALEAPLGARVSVTGEVQRVFYREIPTFTSASLPTRFLALLGDASSPNFAWRDLTVYALEARLRDDFRGNWSLRLSTQQQPRPSSALLDRALAELYSDSNLALAYERTSERWGELRLGASFSPVSRFLGSAPYLQRGFQTGSQLEFEAQWALPF